ncbi:MAG: aldehyde dehydrogenase family protein, partial [Candidatus Binatia bacterium]|nr:aldehyde dehydrogenase family protein [Candidatus Binatia bacterium]
MSLEVLAPETRNFIDGELVEGSTGKRFENINPASGESIGTCADGTSLDMETAIAAARKAFDETDWSRNAPLRAKCLRQIHEGLQSETEQLRAIVTAEAGAPVALSSFMQIDGPIEHMAYWAEKAATFEAESEMSDIPFFGQQNRRILRREAVGVVGAITP